MLNWDNRRKVPSLLYALKTSIRERRGNSIYCHDFLLCLDLFAFEIDTQPPLDHISYTMCIRLVLGGLASACNKSGRIYEKASDSSKLHV